MDNEIAVCWCLGNEWGGRRFIPDTEENRLKTIEFIDSEESVHGKNTHWMIVRKKLETKCLS